MNPLLSVTDLTSYLYCPRKFFLEKVKGIRAPPNKMMIEGKTKHEVVELFSKSEQALVESFDKKMPAKDITISYLSMLTNLIDKILCDRTYTLQKYSISPSSINDTIVVSMNNEILLRAKAVEQAMDQGWLGKDIWENLQPKYLSEFSLESPTLGLKGKIDRVMLAGESIVPFELKTRAIETVFETDEVQLTAYAMLLEENFKKSIPHGILESGNVRHKLEIKPEMKTKVLSLIQEIHSLKENPKFPANLSKCRECRLKKECEAL